MNRFFIMACIAVLSHLLLALPVPAAPLSAEEARAIAADAYVYGFAPVLREVRRVNTQGGTNRMTVFTGERMDHATIFSGIPADIWYAEAYLDLAKEPVVFCLPDMAGRRFSCTVTDAYTTVIATPGAPQAGAAICFAVTGPGWKGEPPKGVTEIRSPTGRAWVTCRVRYEGDADREALGALMPRFSLTPLSQFVKGKRLAPAQGGKGQPGHGAALRDLLLMDRQAFFGRLALFLKRNPAPRADAAILTRIGRIGIDAETGFFDTGELSQAARSAVEQGMKDGLERIRAYTREGSAVKEGWRIVSNIPGETAKYMHRSAAAYLGIGETLPQDSLWAMCDMDSQGRRLNGMNRYVLHFEKDRMPPAESSWCMAVDGAGGPPSQGMAGRSSVCSLDGLAVNADGSLDIAIQRDSPGPDRAPNWLQAPDKDFAVVLRLSWPVEGGHTYPGVVMERE